MSKLDIGVGEDFPVQQSPETEPERHCRHHRHGRRGHHGHDRDAMLALLFALRAHRRGMDAAEDCR